jgi:hypothetical protein
MRRYLLLGTAAAALGATPAEAQLRHYDGVCEASAASLIDATHFVVASDETETLTIYRRGNHPAPVSTFRHANVSDLEASARIGNVIFWLTSHSFNNSGEDKPKRKLLFATRIVAGPALAAAGTEFRGLRTMIAGALGIPEAALAPQLNIEGLAATPEGDLLVGLRGPLTPGGAARVVRIRNPLALVGLAPAGVTARAELAGSLNLGGRGIRSMERINLSGARRYLIVAGPVQDAGAAPLLFWWDGVGAATPGPVAPLVGLNPEALYGNAAGVQILGDNGDACSDEDAAPRWFHGLLVRF